MIYGKHNIHKSRPVEVYFSCWGIIKDLGIQFVLYYCSIVGYII